MSNPEKLEYLLKKCLGNRLSFFHTHRVPIRGEFHMEIGFKATEQTAVTVNWIIKENYTYETIRSKAHQICVHLSDKAYGHILGEIKKEELPKKKSDPIDPMLQQFVDLMIK